jgi:hypothetical protein
VEQKGSRKTFFKRFAKKKFAEDDKAPPEVIKEQEPYSLNRRDSKYDLTSDSEYEEAFLKTKI